jgi:uncharacterized protein
VSKPSPGRSFRSSIHGVLLGCLLLLPAGCANYQRTLDASYREAAAQNYDGALARLEGSSLAGSKNNRLLYLLERGVLLHLAQRHRESNDVLEEADRLAEELFTRSISAESLSFVSSDRLIPYAGEDYESAYIHYYKARNYLVLGELQSARVEARKIDEKLSHLADRHEGRHVYRESAFLRLLTGFIHEALGDWNDAYIAYHKSLGHYREYERKYGVGVPAFLWGRLLLAARHTGFQEEYDSHRAEARAAGLDPVVEEGMIAVLIDRGYIPVKREVFAVFPTPQGFPVKLALPEFQSRMAPAAGPVEVSVNSLEWLPAERVEDVGAIARQSLEDKKGRVVAKMIARAVAKQLAARKAEKELGPAAGLLAQVAALATENADLRSWTMLPDQVLVAVIPAGPGRHQVTIRQGQRVESQAVEIGERAVGFVMIRM